MNASTKATAEPCDYNHVYLYAKGHYKKSKSVVKDLAKILGTRAGMEAKYYKTEEIADQLLSLAFEHICKTGNPDHFFRELIKHSSPEGNWRVGGKNTHSIFGKRKKGARSENYWVRVIRSCLSVLRHTVCMEKGEVVLFLGEPDPSILPLSKIYKTNPLTVPASPDTILP
jgi:hypothetical protein